MARTYPLDWPSTHDRTDSLDRRRSRFKSSRSASFVMLRDELARFGAENIIVSSDMKQRQDGGGFLSSQSEPADPGIVARFQWGGRPFIIACDGYNSVAGNLRAVQETIAAMRAIDRHGSTRLLEQAVSGFSALPPAAGDPVVTARPWWEVFDIAGLGGFSIEEIASDSTNPLREAVLKVVESVYRDIVRKNHPDRDHDPTVLIEAGAAIQSAREALK